MNCLRLGLLIFLSFLPFMTYGAPSLTQSSLDQWCDDMIQEAYQAKNLGDNRKSMQILKNVLVSQPNHRKALSLIGFDLRRGKIIPRDDQLLKNGWALKNKRWISQEEFDYENYQLVSNEIKLSINEIIYLMRKDKDIEKPFSDLNTYVQERGVTAVPILSKLAKNLNFRRQAIALKLLVPLKPEHLEDYLLKNYPREKKDLVAANQASVLASLHPDKVPTSLVNLMSKGTDQEAFRVAQLAGIIEDKELVPHIVGRWVKIREEVETRGGGARNVTALLNQRAYVRDLKAVVGVGVGLFDPDIGYTQSGGVLDARTVKVEIFRTVLMKLTGISGENPKDFLK